MPGSTINIIYCSLNSFYSFSYGKREFEIIELLCAVSFFPKYGIDSGFGTPNRNIQ